MTDPAIQKSKNILPFQDSSSMGADLGLFNQLLQMIDGDWSDSIRGICDHIVERFDAMGVVLSIFDRQFNEFFYIVDSLPRSSREALTGNNIPLDNDSAIEAMKRLYKGNDNFLNHYIFCDKELYEMAAIYFDSDINSAQAIIDNLNLKSIVAIPVLKGHHQYECCFHIGTDRTAKSVEMEHIGDYSTQLNIALEIIFLVRELYIKATHDSLTHLFNHKQGEILLRKEIDRVERTRQPLCAVMADVDHFKKVNDSFGHQAGDQVLGFMGGLFSEKLRKCDIISRYGGEEFLLILPDTGLQHAVEVIRRIKDVLERHTFNFSGTTHSITASFGVAQFDISIHREEKELIGDADRKLYLAKQNGRNRIEF
ncbi:MAG: hypothetical protein CVV44_01120 [Spirochaetae bacterium HGW-Spirochaetae-1]|jgi:diguanylate cyclase (GGDEF)-like protein|nr:MAG: hypothetical protein CVV44_01120 [Spirochaetae bacterium HGW-Spirochaetae-1]